MGHIGSPFGHPQERALKLMLSNWKHRGYIELEKESPGDDIGQQIFRKTEAYLKKYSG